MKNIGKMLIGGLGFLLLIPLYENFSEEIRFNKELNKADIIVETSKHQGSQKIGGFYLDNNFSFDKIMVKEKYDYNSDQITIPLTKQKILYPWDNEFNKYSKIIEQTGPKRTQNTLDL